MKDYTIQYNYANRHKFCISCKNLKDETCTPRLDDTLKCINHIKVKINEFKRRL